MWNFGIPSSLKAWIDHVVRAGKTFNYVGGAVDGLAKGKKAILVLASGGIFSERGLGNHGIPWSRICARFRASLELDDVQTVRAGHEHTAACDPCGIQW